MNRQLSTGSASSSITMSTKSPLPPIPAGRQSHLEQSVENSDMSELALPLKIFQGKRMSIKDLSKGLSSYLWFRRIKEIFLLFGTSNDDFTKFDMDLARQDMIKTCEQYLENQHTKSSDKVEEKDRWKNKRFYAETFRMSYATAKSKSNEKLTGKAMSSKFLSGGEIPRFENALWWYSCNEAPIFDQMNNILRLENFELLMCHRYYISDLCQKIEQWYALNKFTEKKTVYRADKISVQDYESIKSSMNSKNARIAINGFISTSDDEKISYQYAKKKLDKAGEMIVILYEITIDPLIPCSSYADIQSISFHPEEKEILFNMGSTFQIDSVEDDPENTNVKRVKLTARDFKLNLLDEMKNKVKNASQAALSLLLVEYLIELGEDRVCKRYLNQLIESKQLENDSNLVLAFKYLGKIYLRQDLYNESLKFFRKALNIQARVEYSNNNAMSDIYNYIGKAHLALKQFEEAKENLEEGIRIQKREPKSSQENLQSLLSTLGEVYYAQDDFDEAETRFEEAFGLYNRDNKMSYDALEKRLAFGDTCIAYGHLRSVQNSNDSNDIEQFEKALNIFQSILPDSHPKVIQTQIEIVSELISKEKFSIVIEYLESCTTLLNDYEGKATTSKIDLSNLYFNIGAVFADQENFNSAIEYWIKGFHYELQSYFDHLLSPDHSPKVVYHEDIVERYFQATHKYLIENQNSSIEHIHLMNYRLKNYQEIFKELRNIPSLVVCDVCISMKNATKALTAFKRIRGSKEIDNKLKIGIILRALELPNSNSFVAELISMKSLLVPNDDKENFYLLMIINDKLAEIYLDDEKKLEACSVLCKESMNLKQKVFSLFHHSLAKNHRILGDYHYKRNDFKNAISSYEKAIEIQLESLPEDHVEVCRNYFRLADCYCKTGQIEWAINFYGRAEPSMEDSKSFLKKFSNLAESYEKKNQLAESIEQLDRKIEVLTEMLPEFALKCSFACQETKKLIEERLHLDNQQEFARILRNVLIIERWRARALRILDEQNDDEDATSIFERSIKLQKKLIQFQDDSDQSLSDVHRELSEAYRELYPTVTEEIRKNLEKSFEGTEENQRDIIGEFRLAKLLRDNQEYSAAHSHLKNTFKVVNDQIAKEIVRRCLKKNRVNLSDSDDELSDSEDELDLKKNSKTSNSLTIMKNARKTIRGKSTKSKETPENLQKVGDAFLLLGDQTKAVEYFQQAISTMTKIDETNQSELEFEREHQPIIQCFYNILMSSVEQKSNTININNKPLLFRMDLQNKIFLSSESFELRMRALNDIFQISKKLKLSSVSCDSISDFIKRDINTIDWNYEIELPLQDQIQFLFSLGEFYLSQQEWVKSLDIYSMLQDKIDAKSDLQSVISFAIGKILQFYISSDAEYRQQIDLIKLDLTEMTKLDQTIICQMIVDFMKEVKDEDNQKIFSKYLNDYYTDLTRQIDFSESIGIGGKLFELDQKHLLELYWNDVACLYNGVFTENILQLFFNEDVTFDDIFESTQKMLEDFEENFLLLAETYKIKAKIEEQAENYAGAIQSLEKSIELYQRIPSEKDTVEQLKKLKGAILA